MTISTANLEATGSPRLNNLLAGLPDEDWARLNPLLEPIRLRQGQALYEPTDAPEHGYFPITAIISLVGPSTAGHSSEIAIIGRDGLVGVAHLVTGCMTHLRPVISHGGSAFRMKSQVLRAEFALSGVVTDLVSRHSQTLLQQISQIQRCNLSHTIQQRLCRWLLLRMDRLDGHSLTTTQMQIATMLGVRRDAITESALRLRLAGVLSYQRGHITVTSRAGLQERCCECYNLLAGHSPRLHAAPHAASRGSAVVGARLQ